MNDVAEVAALMVAIADAECRGDGAFFAALLHERFVMLRPNGLTEGRDGFIGRLAAGGERVTDLRSVELHGAKRAVATAVVRKRGDGAAAWEAHDNLRVFVREAAGEPWRLIAWLNEPAD